MRIMYSKKQISTNFIQNKFYKKKTSCNFFCIITKSNFFKNWTKQAFKSLLFERKKLLSVVFKFELVFC